MFNKALKCDDKFCPDLSKNIMKELSKQTARKHIWPIADADDFEENACITVQVELESFTMKGTWSVFSARVVDDTTMSEIATECLEVQPLPAKSTTRKYNIKIVTSPCLKLEGTRFFGRSKPLPPQKKVSDLIKEGDFNNFRLRAVPN